MVAKALFGLVLAAALLISGCNRATESGKEPSQPPVSHPESRSEESRKVINSRSYGEWHDEWANEEWVDFSSLGELKYCESEKVRPYFDQSLDGFGDKNHSPQEFFGEAWKIEAEQDGNWTVYYYPGLRIEWFEDEFHSYPYFIALKSNQYILRAGPGIGFTRDAVIKMLGAPSGEQNGHLIYFFNAEITDETWVFYFKDEVLYKITWDAGTA